MSKKRIRKQVKDTIRKQGREKEHEQQKNNLQRMGGTE